MEKPELAQGIYEAEAARWGCKNILYPILNACQLTGSDTKYWHQTKFSF